MQTTGSSAASPMAVYSLMEWYKSTNAEAKVPKLWQDYVSQQQELALTALNKQWRDGLVNRSASLLVPDPEHFIVIDPSPLAARTDWTSIKSQLFNLKVLLKAPRKVPVPVAQASHDIFWPENEQNAKKAFAAWAHQRSLTLPEPTGLDRKKLLKQLDDMHKAIEVKMTIVTALQQANTLAKDHEYFKAMDLLDKIRAPYATTENPLIALQDKHTLPLLKETADLIPFSCIRHGLNTMEDRLKGIQKKTSLPFDPLKNSLATADQQLAELETMATVHLNQWIKDRRCQAARKKFQLETRKLIAEIAQVRIHCWKHALSQDFENIDLRTAMDRYLKMNELLQVPNHRQFHLYAIATLTPQSELLFREYIRQELQRHAISLLPKALDLITDAADLALKVNRKPGFAMALAYLARQMSTVANAQELPEIKAKLKKLDLIFTQAHKTIEDNVLKRVVAISDMSSAVPGLGLTYTQDVIHALERLLKAFGMEHLVTIATTTVPMTQYSYNLYDGVVADFNGSETIERQNVRIIRRFGEIKKSPNPDFQEDETKPPHIFTQEVYEQLINVREIERLAHVRAFINMRGPGFTTLIEVNEFYSKRFIIEDSHPFNDLRVIDVLKTYDLAKHPVQDAIPALTYDRIWTPGEMLDWARKDSLRVFALKLFFHINQFPFLLESQARRFEQENNLQDCTEFWTYCFTLTEQINPDAATYSNVLNETSKPAAKCYEQCISDLRQQRNEIIDLKKKAHDMMTLKAGALLHSLRKQ